MYSNYESPIQDIAISEKQINYLLNSIFNILAPFSKNNTFTGERKAFAQIEYKSLERNTTYSVLKTTNYTNKFQL